MSEAFYHRAVEEGRQVIQRERVITNKVASLQKNFVRDRIMVVGAYADQLAGDRAEYGARILEQYSVDIDLHLTLVRDARRAFVFFMNNDETIDQWIERKIDENGIVTWADVRRKIKQPDDPAEALANDIINLERLANKVEQAQEKVRTKIAEIDPSDPIQSEARGVIERTNQVIEEMAYAAVPKIARVQCPEYSTWIKKQPCFVHRGYSCIGESDMVDPAHVKSKGSGGSDGLQLPACRTVHRESHQHSWKYIEKKYNVNIFEEVARHLHRFLFGSDCTFPSELYRTDQPEEQPIHERSY